LQRAKVVANYLGLENTQVMFGSYFQEINLLDTMKKTIKHYGEPINLMQIIYSDLLLRRMHQDGIKVAVG
jgi:asparagine synthetase B (glutamine-hydrolysing)